MAQWCARELPLKALIALAPPLQKAVRTPRHMLAAALHLAIAGVIVLGSISGFIYWRNQVGAKRRLAGLRMLESAL